MDAQMFAQGDYYVRLQASQCPEEAPPERPAPPADILTDPQVRQINNIRAWLQDAIAALDEAVRELHRNDYLDHAPTKMVRARSDIVGADTRLEGLILYGMKGLKP